MKVYRCLSWYDNDKNGNYNELLNFTEHGLISPTYSYLWKNVHVYNEGTNTFGDEREMYKYFFASLSDALWFAMEDNTNIFLIEVDFPEELLKRYIGLGYYGPLQIEYQIPYKELFETMADRPNNYTLQALNYYNANLYIDDLDCQPDYKKIADLLPQVPYQGIHMKERLSIYPLFCFKPKDGACTAINQCSQAEVQSIAEDIKKLRDKKYDFEGKCKSIICATDFLINYDQNYPKDKLFDFSVPIIQEENEELKRILSL